MCKYCEKPHYEITLPCVGVKILEYPKDNKYQWIKAEFSYKCPKCGAIWKGQTYCNAD